MEQFAKYQTFSIREDALELTDLLQENEIQYQLETGAEGFDPAFAFKDEFRILIQPKDFEKVDALFTASASDDYYLFQFKDEELLEVIAKRDEWSHYDFVLAQKILKDRGTEIQPEVIESLGKQRIAELEQPEKSHAGWIIAGYIFAFFGGFFGLLIGWSILNGKKILPNGEKVYTYSKKDRENARWIVIISIVTFSLGMILKFIGKIDLFMN